MKKKINISIDDISPHPQSSVKVLDNCYRLIDDYPSIKFTLFIPMAYTRCNEVSYDIRNDAKFCDTLRNLPKEHFEFGWHGVRHGIAGQSSNNEFMYLNHNQCMGVLQNMFTIAKKAGVYDLFEPILRPSAFRMSPASFNACKAASIEVLALSRDLDYGGQDKEFKYVVYYDCNPPHKPLKVRDLNEIVYHACEWDLNYLSESNLLELKSFLDKSIEETDFIFMKGMGE